MIAGLQRKRNLGNIQHTMCNKKGKGSKLLGRADNWDWTWLGPVEPSIIDDGQLRRTFLELAEAGPAAAVLVGV